MGNHRTPRISARDVEVLEFIARFGVVSRRAVSIWAATAQTATLTRERRLLEAGLIEVRCGVWGEGKLAAASVAGLSLCGRGEMRPARFSLATVRHDALAAEIAAGIERDGGRVMSEREIAAAEREREASIYSAQVRPGRSHRADLLRLREEGPPQAIEVELTAKGRDRLDGLLRAWRRAVGERRVGGVTYLCPPRTLALVERAVRRTKTESVVTVAPLRPESGP